MHINRLYNIHIYCTSPTFILLAIWRPKSFLGALPKLRKATVSFTMSVCPFTPLSLWNNSAPTFVKFDMITFLKYVEEIHVSLKFGKKTVTLHKDVSIFMIIRLSPNGKLNIRLRLTPSNVTSITDKSINYSNIFSNIYSDKKCTSHMPAPLTPQKFARPSL